MKVIGFYTVGDGSSYEEEAELWARSLECVGMPYLLRRMESRGDWYANTAYKAVFCREMREKLDGPLVWIDVDAVVHENCEDYFDALGSAGYDFGAHWFRGPAKGRDRSKVRENGWWMLSGTLFLGDTSPARKLLDAWVRLNEMMAGVGAHDGGGQANLWWLVTKLQNVELLRVKRFPGSYTWVFDKPWAYTDEEHPVITHTIASRDHRAERRHTRRNEYIAQLRDRAGLP